jgi:hypothetical protein
MKHSSTLYVGLDIHKESIAVAHLSDAKDAEVLYLDSIGTRQSDIDNLVPGRPLLARSGPPPTIQQCGRGCSHQGALARLGLQVDPHLLSAEPHPLRRIDISQRAEPTRIPATHIRAPRAL